jgi:hypothetical protein
VLRCLLWSLRRDVTWDEARFERFIHLDTDESASATDLIIENPLRPHHPVARNERPKGRQRKEVPSPDPAVPFFFPDSPDERGRRFRRFFTRL